MTDSKQHDDVNGNDFTFDPSGPETSDGHSPQSQAAAEESAFKAVVSHAEPTPRPKFALFNAVHQKDDADEEREVGTIGDDGDEQHAPAPSTGSTTAPAQTLPGAPETRASQAPDSMSEKPRVAPSIPAYTPPKVRTRNPAAESARADLAADSSHAKDAKALGASKMKLAVVGAFVVVALAIGASTLLGKGAATNAAAAAGQAPPAGAGANPTPGAAVPAAPAAPGVGLDIGNTRAISLETGDVDMVEQGRPIPPAEQSCTVPQMSGATQQVCKAMGVAHYFECAPDGFHQDPRIPGCAPT